MNSLYDGINQLINNCDLYFEGHIISKELLIKNYADFLANNFEKKHNVAISLHTGSVCFDIITILISMFSNIICDQLTIDDFIESLTPGSILLNGKERCRFEGFSEPHIKPDGSIVKRIKIITESVQHGQKTETTTLLPQSKWNQLKPYNGPATRLDARGVRADNKKRNNFLTSVLKMDPKEIPAFIEKSSVVVMNRDYAEKIIDNLEIGYNNNRIKIAEIMPVSYCTENEEYPLGGNPGKIEPALKITSSISTARSIVTGTWQGNENWINDIVGVSIIGFSAISRARTEVSEMMKRRKLKYVFVSYNISSEDGETLLDEVEDSSVFACTTEYLLNSSLPVVEQNPYTLELNKQVDSVINHQTIAVPVKTFDCDWKMYKKIQLALSRLCRSGYKEVEDFVPLAHSVMNLMINSVFSFQSMENMIEAGLLDTESPLQRIIRLNGMLSSFADEIKDTAKSIINFLDDGYVKLFSTSPKKQILFDLLSEHRNQKVAIIVPRAYYSKILYNLNVLDYFDNENHLYISTANSFDYSQQYDAIIAIGAFWGSKFDPFRCRASSTVYVIVSAVEKNLLIYRKNLAFEIEKKFNKSANISTKRIDETPEEYSDGATENEIIEIIDSSSELNDYINKIFETQSLALLNSGMGANYSKTEISHIATCADGESIFFTKKYTAFVFDSAKEDVLETSVDKLSPGDTVIFKSNNNETKDIVTTLLDKYIDEYHTVSDEVQMAYLKSRYWKEILKEYREANSLSFKELSKRLETFGSKKHDATIQSWLSEDSYIVGPKDVETYIAIAEMTQNPDMLAEPKSFCIACDKIRSIRVGILKLIAKTIINKYKGSLAIDDDMTKVVSENIEDISILVQIETITPVEGQNAPINMINRPIALN